MITEIISGIMALICVLTGTGEMTENEPVDIIINTTHDTAETDSINITVDPIHPEIEKIEMFLKNDQTDKAEYLRYHSCGHFARALSQNASAAGMNISAIIITENPYPIIKGYSNHLINYFVINGTIYFIEPQNDMIYTANDIWKMGYNHGKLYPDGTQAPTNFRGRMAATYNLSAHLDEQLPK